MALSIEIYSLGSFIGVDILLTLISIWYLVYYKLTKKLLQGQLLYAQIIGLAHLVVVGYSLIDNSHPWLGKLSIVLILANLFAFTWTNLEFLQVFGVLSPKISLARVWGLKVGFILLYLLLSIIYVISLFDESVLSNGLGQIVIGLI